MSRLRTNKSQRKRHKRQIIGLLQNIRPVAVILLFAVAVAVCFVTVAAVSLASGGGTDPSAGPTLTKGQAAANAQCGMGNKPACPTPIVPWVTLRSDSPADVLAAAKSTSMFVSASTTNDPIGVALRTGTLGQPALVKPYVENTMMDEVWVIPVVAGSGYPSALLEFVYDPAHNRIRAASFDAVGNGMFYASHPFPFVDATQAAAVVQQVRKTSVMVGQTPELIYFPTDHQAVLAGKTTWTGGGETVIDPIWRVPGADGHYSYVAHSQQVYSAGEIPVASSLPVMPDLVG